jgi:hypothetical protein
LQWISGKRIGGALTAVLTDRPQRALLTDLKRKEIRFLSVRMKPKSQRCCSSEADVNFLCREKKLATCEFRQLSLKLEMGLASKVILSGSALQHRTLSACALHILIWTVWANMGCSGAIGLE